MHVNPYYFLLLRRLIEFEVEKRLSTKPTIKAIGEYIYSRYGDNKYYKSKSEKIRRYVLSKNIFNFDVGVLNFMSEQPQTLGSYRSWKNFLEIEGRTGLAREAKRYDNVNYSTLNNDEAQYVRSLAERRLGELYVLRSQEGKIFNRGKTNIIWDEDTFHYKKANKSSEVRQIVNLAERVYPCPINKADIKLSWFAVNPDIFYMCLDDYDELIANINLLPVTENFYQKLKCGDIYESDLTPDDIVPNKEIPNIRYIYIEGLASISKIALYGFRSRFKEILKGITDRDFSEIIIFSIGGSIEGDNIMLSHGFKKTSMAIDRKGNHEFPFYEVGLSDLLLGIREKTKRIN